MSGASIRSEGDLEVALLHEADSVLTDIIGPELFSVGGTQPEQSVLFYMRSCFNLFLILISEFFAEGPQSPFIDEKYKNWSLLKGLGWFCTIHPDGTSGTGLDLSVFNLEGWVTKEVPFRFWCPDVTRTLSLYSGTIN